MMTFETSRSLNTEQVRFIHLDSEIAQMAFAAKVAGMTEGGFIILLNGDLGAGKTTFARGFIQASGFDGLVKSPTYTLVEPYPIEESRMCYHFDLYRLAEPEELEFTGARDYFNENAVCLVEWPEKAEGFLPPADWVCVFSYENTGRNLNISALTDKGKELMLQVFSDF
jgi:tRNA threonylcarbamoyladenosine biosynthesis protein TsaE